MYKIGDFAKLARITIKAIRHYERLGLLKPAMIDRFSGYRYYTELQLEQVNRIQAYKDLGFPLRQIRLLLSESQPIEQLRAMLETRRNELAIQLQLEQARLQRVEARLLELEQISKPSLKHLSPKEIKMNLKLISHAAMTLVGIRYQGKNENDEITGIWDQFNPRVVEISQKVPHAAYGYCAWLPEAPAGEFEYIAAFAVEKAEMVPEGMVVRTVPAATYAVFTLIGGKEGIPTLYQRAYHEDIPQAGYKPKGGFDLEVYAEDFKFFTPDSIMYIWIPVEKA